MKDEADSPRFFPHEIIGGVRLLQVLRVRKNAEIWYVGHLQTGEPQVLKILYPEQICRAHFAAMSGFLQTADAPGLIRVLQSGETVNNCPYILMEYAPNGTLRTFLRQAGKGSFPQAVYLLRQMLAALSCLEDQGIVHRDIKPENIWIAADGSLRLGDFGIARFPGVAEEPGRIFGTARYCAPEQAADSTRLDCRSDLYSLGTVVVEVLTGSPFRQEDSFAAARQSVTPGYGFLREQATEHFAGLVRELLNSAPENRPASPAEVLVKLEQMNLPEAPFLLQA